MTVQVIFTYSISLTLIRHSFHSLITTTNGLVWLTFYILKTLTIVKAMAPMTP